MTNRVWLTTTEAVDRLGVSRETLRQLRLRGVLKPGQHFRRVGCQPRSPIQWHPDNIDAAVASWNKRNLAAV